jgi:arsenate reductase|tara:strand:+ start:67 stop:411 length:345 start_codon:yes stop_codon:yes gene_type:complete
MIRIYHNSRCSKSRETLDLLKSSELDFEIVEYLKEKLTKNQIQVLINKLGLKPLELVRKNEAIWKENFKNKVLTNNEIVEILSKNPKLIERPIVESNNKAIIGRPPENVFSLFH